MYSQKKIEVQQKTYKKKQTREERIMMEEAALHYKSLALFVN